jgi:hypothetical protein
MLKVAIFIEAADAMAVPAPAPGRRIALQGKLLASSAAAHIDKETS